MPNLERIQVAWTKTGLTVIGRIVRQADLYYYDFITGGNTFLATDSVNTRISMPARSAPQSYIYESGTFNTELWSNGWYEWQTYDSISGKLLGYTHYYLSSGKVVSFLSISDIKAKTDNLPIDPASEAYATANTFNIITEINANETKLDSIQLDTTAIKSKTDSIPADPTSETNATTNKSSIISEINQNESKIDFAQSDITAIKAKTDLLPTDPASESNATLNAGNIITEINQNETKIDSVKTDTVSIKAKTDNLPIDPASESSATSNTNLIISEINTNEGKLDIITLITSAVKDKTDLLPDDPASQSLTDDSILNSQTIILSELNDIGELIGNIIPDIFSYMISDTAASGTFEYYIRYTTRQVG